MRSLRIYGVVGEKVKPYDSSGFPRHSQTGQFEMAICIVIRIVGRSTPKVGISFADDELQSKEFAGRLLIPVLSPLALGKSDNIGFLMLIPPRQQVWLLIKDCPTACCRDKLSSCNSCYMIFPLLE